MSTVVLDTITGKSTATTITIGSTPVVSASANSMTIRGEGSAQTSIQGGLAKVWHRLGLGTGTIVIRDSLNVSSFTDGGVGLYTVTIATNMSNILYGVLQGESDWRTTGITDEAAITTADYDMTSRSPSTAAALDSVTHTSSVLGDLA
tara:strand:+ start:258 stop:701 length:444 start_codon:yes stop_codon:yes gene_type:complete